MFLAIVPSAATSSVKATNAIELISTENHHIAELNSNQLYVAGFHVNTPDLETRERVRATAVTISFPSTDTSYFSSESWLGAGMFVQGQESKALDGRTFVDYGFYTMLVLDAEGSLFLDVGMHQTREESPPLHRPTAQLIYAYTWQVLGVDPATPITLCAKWGSEGWLCYSISASGSNITLPPVNVPSFPDCGPIFREFYAGNVVLGPFPFSRYIHYFQFGVLSPTKIADIHWSADLRNPRLLRKTGWDFVDVAWSIQGDISFLDFSWLWGGSPHHGVSAQYYQNPLENPHEVMFFYNGQTLPPGTILWQYKISDSTIKAAKSSTSLQPTSQLFGNHPPFFLVLIAVILACATLFGPPVRQELGRLCAPASTSAFSQVFP